MLPWRQALAGRCQGRIPLRVWPAGYRQAHRIMFGGDYPLYTFERLTSEWKAEGYSQTILDKVFQQNAEAFLSGVTR